MSLQQVKGTADGRSSQKKKKVRQPFTSSRTLANISGSSLAPSPHAGAGWGLCALDGDFTHISFCLFCVGWRFYGTKTQRDMLVIAFSLLLRACRGKSLCCGCRDDKRAVVMRDAATYRSYSESSRPARMILVRFLKSCQWNPSWIEILFKHWCSRKSRLSSTFVLWGSLQSQGMHSDAVCKANV